MSNLEKLVSTFFDSTEEFDKYNSFNKASMYRWSNSEVGSDKHNQLKQAVIGAKAIQLGVIFGKDK